MTITKLAELPDGIHEGVPSAVYHARTLGLVSKGALDEVLRSPMHYRTWLDATDEEETPALLFGRAFHTALLEPDIFARAFAAEPDFGDCRRTANKAARDDWRMGNAGKTLVTSADGEAIRGMVAAVHAHPLAGKMIRDGQAELTALWKDADTGLQCRARADYYVAKHAMLIDAKSTLDASPEGFRKSVFGYGYHRQDALYRQGFAACGAEVKFFCFLAVEKTPPYAVAVYVLDASALSLAQESVRSLIRRLAECASKNEWPGYPQGITTLETPPWAR